jgi:hypothetical protein
MAVDGRKSSKSPLKRRGLTGSRYSSREGLSARGEKTAKEKSWKSGKLVRCGEAYRSWDGQHTVQHDSGEQRQDRLASASSTGPLQQVAGKCIFLSPASISSPILDFCWARPATVTASHQLSCKSGQAIDTPSSPSAPSAPLEPLKCPDLSPSPLLFRGRRAEAGVM